jgi:hypothetical protein
LVTLTPREGDSMFGNGRHATAHLLAIGLAGLTLLAAAGPALASNATAASTGTSSAVPATARAAAARPATARAAVSVPNRYHTWKAAQRNAGFKLKRPHKTFGLVRKNPILVGKCEASGARTKADVYAQYTGSHQRFLTLDQTDYRFACSNFGAARYLGSYRIRGRKARLYGFCGSKGQPSCTSIAAILVLAWRAGSRFYTTYSSQEWRATLVSFARNLRFV